MTEGRKKTWASNWEILDLCEVSETPRCWEVSASGREVLLFRIVGSLIKQLKMHFQGPANCSSCLALTGG